MSAPSILTYDDWLPRPQLAAVQALAEAAFASKAETEGPGFSWYAPQERLHISRLPIPRLELAEAYIDNLVTRLAPLLGGGATGYEWWSNHGNTLGWHVDKDEQVFRARREYRHPLWSTVFYPDVAIPGRGGELILLSDDSQARPYDYDLSSREIAQRHHAVTPRTNRLVVFRRGFFHRIDPFEGRRTSLAMNLWDAAPAEFDAYRDSRFCHAVG